jgi:UDP-N-acetylmuramyl pentapeptide synthase
MDVILAGDMLLVKGSRGLHMEEIVAALGQG